MSTNPEVLFSVGVDVADGDIQAVRQKLDKLIRDYNGKKIKMTVTVDTSSIANTEKMLENIKGSKRHYSINFQSNIDTIEKKITSGIKKIEDASKNAAAKTAINYTVPQLGGGIMGAINSSGLDNMREKTEETRKAAKSLEEQFTSTFQTHIVNQAVSFMVEELQRGVDAIIEMDSTLASIRYTMNGTDAQFYEMGKKVRSSAIEMGTSISSVSEAAKVYANMNETFDSIMAKARPSVILSNLTGLNTEKATDALQSLMNQFELTDDQAMHVVDSLTKISASMKMDFARGIQFMVESVKAAGSIMADADVPMEQYLAMVGSITEQTRLSGSQIGNGFKTIVSRIQRVTDEDTTQEDISNADKAFQSVGVNVRKSATEFKSFSEVIAELGAKWDYLTDTEKSYVAEQASGIRQKQIFLAMMNSLTQSTALYNEALNSSGYAESRQAIYEDTIVAKMEKMKSIMASGWIEGFGDDGIKDTLDSLNFIAETFSVIVTVAGKILTLFDGIGLKTVVFTGMAKIFREMISHFSDMSRKLKDVNDGLELKGAVKGKETVNRAVNSEMQDISRLDKAATGNGQSQGSEFLGGLKTRINNPKSKAGQSTIGALNKFGSSKIGKFLGSETGSELAYGVGSSLSTWADEEIGGTVSAITTGLGAAVGSVIPGVGTALGAAFGSLVSPFVTMALDAVYVTDKELTEMRQKSQEITSAWKDNYNTLESNKAVLQSLKGEYESLSKGVGLNGENISLDTSDYERYKEICNEIAQISPELVKGTDAQNNAILRKNASLDEAIARLERQQELEDAALLKSKDDVFDAAKESAKKLEGEKKQSDNDLYFAQADIQNSDAELKRLEALKQSVASGEYDRENGFERDAQSIETHIANIQYQIDAYTSRKNKLESDRVQYLNEIANAEKQIDTEAANVFDTIGVATLRQSATYKELGAQVQDYMMEVGRTLNPAQFKDADAYQKELLSMVEAFDSLREDGTGKQERVVSFLEIKDAAANGTVSIRELNESYRELQESLGEDLVTKLHLNADLDELEAIKDVFKEIMGMPANAEFDLGNFENLNLDGLEKMTAYLNSFGEGQGEAAKTAFTDLQAVLGQLSEQDSAVLNEILGSVDPTSALSVQNANQALQQFINTAMQTYQLTPQQINTFFNAFTVGGDKIQAVTDQFSNAIATMKSYANQIADINSAYETLAKGETLDFDTIMGILENSPELGDNIAVNQNGVISLEKDALLELMEAKEQAFKSDMKLKRLEMEATQANLEVQLAAIEAVMVSKGLLAETEVNAATVSMIGMDNLKSKSLEWADNTTTSQLGVIEGWYGVGQATLAAEGMSDEQLKTQHDLLKQQIEKSKEAIEGLKKLVNVDLTNSLNGGDTAQKAWAEYNKRVSQIERNLAKTVDDINKNLAKLDDEEHLNALTESIQDVKTEIDALSSAASLIDTELDIAWENDFVTKSDLLSEKFMTLQEKGRLMKEEFERLAATTPKNAKEAQTLADRLQSLGEEIRGNVRDLIELENQLSTLRIEAISANTEGTAEQLEREMTLLDRNLAALEDGFILGEDALFSDMFMLPVIPKSVLEQKREQDDLLIEEEQRYQQVILEIIKEYHRLQKEENQKAIDEQREQQKQRRVEAENTAAEDIAAAYESVSGRGGGSGSVGSPSQGYAITASYGQKGRLWSSGYHTGVDYAFPEGTPVISNVSGIAYVNTKGAAYGTHVTVVDDNGYSFLFAHLSRADVSNGQAVSKGVQLGLSGSTGNVSGPHLHYEVRDPDNRTINPGSYVGRATGGVVGQEEFTLIGEGTGEELVVLPNGKAVMLGKDGAELVSLPAGSTVFSAEDTKKILGETGNIDGERILKLDDLVQTPNMYSAAFAEEYRRISENRMNRYDEINKLESGGNSAEAKALKKQLQHDNFMDTYALAFNQYDNALNTYTANLNDVKKILDAAIAAEDIETIQAAMEAIESIQNSIFDVNDKWVANRQRKLEYLQNQALETLQPLQEIQEALEFDNSMLFENQVGLAYFNTVDQYRIKTQELIVYERAAYENLAELYKDANMTEQDRLAMEQNILENTRKLQQEKNALLKQMIADQKAYNKQRVTALNDVQSEIVEMLQWSVDEEKKRLDENLENYREAVQEKIDLIDEEAAAADYEKRLQKEQEKLLELQQQAAKLSASTRYEDKSRLRELNKQIAEQQEALDEMQADHQREVRKESLQDQLEAEEEAVNQRKEWIDEEFSNEELIQKAREGMLTGYVTLANGEYIKLTQAMQNYYDATCASTLEASNNLRLFNSDLERSIELYRQLEEVGLAGGTVGDIGWTDDDGRGFLGLTDAELNQYIANKAEWTYLNAKGSNKTAADQARMNELAAANAALRNGQADTTDFASTYQMTNDILSKQEQDFARYLANKDEYQRLYHLDAEMYADELARLQKANDEIRSRYSGFAGRGGDVFISYDELLNIFGVANRYKAYARGGIDTRGGLALLHGTAQNPEYIFNTPQMKEIEAIVRSATFGAIRLSQDMALPAAAPQERSTTLQIENLIRVDGDVTDKSVLPDVRAVALKVAKTILDAAPKQ